MKQFIEFTSIFLFCLLLTASQAFAAEPNVWFKFDDINDTNAVVNSVLVVAHTNEVAASYDTRPDFNDANSWLTFTADANGAAGNGIAINYAFRALDGLRVSVVDNNITISKRGIFDNPTDGNNYTMQQVADVLDACDGSAALINTTITGDGNALTKKFPTVANTFRALTGGVDACDFNATNNAFYVSSVLGYGVWTKETNMPGLLQQHGFEADPCTGKLYAVCGGTDVLTDSNANYEYDIATKVWVAKTPAPICVQSPVWRYANGAFHLIGGRRLSAPAAYNNTCWKYTPANDNGTPTEPNASCWVQEANMPSKREDMGSAVIDDNIYVFGGIVEGSVSKVVEMFDPKINTWTSKGNNMADNRLLGDFSCSYKGKGYLVSATNTLVGYSNLTPVTSVLEYNSLDDSYKTLAVIPYGVCYKEVEEVNGRIYSISGANTTSTSGFAGNQIYNIEENIWDFNGPVLTRGTEVGQIGAGVTKYNDVIYVCGGYAGVGAYLYSNTLYSYVPASPGRWTSQHSVAGIDGNALDFNGTDYVDANSIHQQNKLTLAGWVKPNDGQPSATQLIFSRIVDDNNCFKVYLKTNGVFEANCIIQGVSKTITLYQNGRGVSALSDGQQGWIHFAAVLPDCNISGTGNLLIGTSFVGAVDDFRVYYDTLSLAEVRGIYKEVYPNAFPVLNPNRIDDRIIRRGRYN